MAKKLTEAAKNLIESMIAADAPQLGYSQVRALKKALEEPATIIRHPKGQGREEVNIDDVQIPDLWHIAMALPEPHQSMILETWHLAHDLLLNLRGEV